MPLDQPDFVRWSDEVVRPAADRLAGAIHLIDQILVDVRPDARDYGALIAGADPAEAVADGAPADGRPAIAAAHVAAFVRLCEVLRDMADDDTDPVTGQPTGVTSRALLHRIAVNPR